MPVNTHITPICTVTTLTELARAAVQIGGSARVSQELG
jgi:hypothetical protein